MREVALRPTIAWAYRAVLGSVWVSLVVVALVQGAVAIVAAPILGESVRLALRAAGLSALTNENAVTLFTTPWAPVILTIALILMVVALFSQTALFCRVALLRLTGRAVTARTVTSGLRARGRRLVRQPSTLLLIPYLLLLVPLGHVGISSVLTTWIAVPAFVSEELTRSPGGAVLYYGAMTVAWYLNVRLVMTVPLLVVTDLSVGRALQRSWAITRWQSWRVVVLFAAIVVPALLAVIVVHLLVLVPTAVADALAPDAAWMVAAAGFGLAQVIVFFLVGLFLLVQTGALVGVVVRAVEPPPQAEPHADATGGGDPRGRTRPHPLPVTVGVAGSLVAAAVVAAHVAPALADASDGTTLILAHRGFTADAVENTLPALEAAREADADLVEFDILQTKDQRWVVMHDTDLQRLTGESLLVADLTLDELTELTVRSGGHHASIPALEEFLRTADALEQPLLIEVKIHGHESDGYIQELLSIIDDIDGADSHIYHSLSGEVVERLAELRPELVVGHIIPLAVGGVLDSPADFFVYEQGAYSRELAEQIRADGGGVLVWTVNDAETMRSLFRQNVDGIITDRPDLAREVLADVADERGMAAKLWDALDRLIVVG